MAERNSKTTFTNEERNRITDLVRDLEKADSSKKKGIRENIRKIGLYWSEVASGRDYTVTNLQKLFECGILKIERDNFDDKNKADKPTLSATKNNTLSPSTTKKDTKKEKHLMNTMSLICATKFLAQKHPANTDLSFSKVIQVEDYLLTLIIQNSILWWSIVKVNILNRPHSSITGQRQVGYQEVNRGAFMINVVKKFSPNMVLNLSLFRIQILNFPAIKNLSENINKTYILSRTYSCQQEY